MAKASIIQLKYDIENLEKQKDITSIDKQLGKQQPLVDHTDSSSSSSSTIRQQPIVV